MVNIIKSNPETQFYKFDMTSQTSKLLSKYFLRGDQNSKCDFNYVIFNKIKKDKLYHDIDKLVKIFGSVDEQYNNLINISFNKLPDEENNDGFFKNKLIDFLINELMKNI